MAICTLISAQKPPSDTWAQELTSHCRRTLWSWKTHRQCATTTFSEGTPGRRTLLAPVYAYLTTTGFLCFRDNLVPDDSVYQALNTISLYPYLWTASLPSPPRLWIWHVCIMLDYHGRLRGNLPMSPSRIQLEQKH